MPSQKNKKRRIETTETRLNPVLLAEITQNLVFKKFQEDVGKEDSMYKFKIAVIFNSFFLA